MNLTRLHRIFSTVGSVLVAAFVCAQSLVQVGYFPFNGLFAVAGYDHYMLTGAGHVVDVSNPFTPQLVGNANIGFGTSVIVEGQYAYFGKGMVPVVHIVDISVASAPISVGSLPLAASAGVFGIAVSGNTLFAANAQQGLASIDISNPLNPELIQQLSIPGGGQARGVVVLGNYAYVADGSGLKIIDITDPADMQILGSLGSGYVSVALSADATRLAVGQAGGGAIVFDLADPGFPQVLYGVPEANGPAYAVQIIEDRLYISSEQYGVRVYLLGPASATLLGDFNNTSNGQSFSAFGLGELVFLTGLVNGAAVLTWGTVGDQEDPPIETSLTCYPVPASDRLNWSLSSDPAYDEVRIIDADGRTVRFELGRPRSIAVDGLSPGMYGLLLLRRGLLLKSARFIKD